MATLAQYLDANREKAYKFATQNTQYNEHGHPTISEDDEWVAEKEWDDLFATLNTERIGGNADE